MQNETTSKPITLAIPRELFHALLLTIAQVRIQGRQVSNDATTAPVIQIDEQIRLIAADTKPHNHR